MDNQELVGPGLEGKGRGMIEVSLEKLREEGREDKKLGKLQISGAGGGEAFTVDHVMAHVLNNLQGLRYLAELKAGEPISDQAAASYMTEAVEIVKEVFADFDKEEVITQAEKTWKGSKLQRELEEKGIELPIREIIEEKEGGEKLVRELEEKGYKLSEKNE